MANAQNPGKHCIIDHFLNSSQFSYGLTGLLGLHDVPACPFVGRASQTARNVGRHFRYIGVTVWSLGVKHTKCGVVLVTGMEEERAAER
jgi:hypothetical protein